MHAGGSPRRGSPVGNGCDGRCFGHWRFTPGGFRQPRWADAGSAETEGGASMKAIRIHAHGGTDVLRYEDVPTPTPGAGQVLVRVEAAGLNFIDVYRRTGLYKVELPHSLGQEAAGTVTALGPGVGGIKVGDRVASTEVPGAY